MTRVKLDDAEELRLALIMNGGVSLAVWMGGIAHELALVMRAPAASSAETDEDPVLKKWQALLGAGLPAVIVDVIAGTSAGGLNGTLLAASVAGRAPLDLRSVWQTTAALEPGKLLAEGEGGLASLLDGTYFLGKVNEILAPMCQRPEPAQHEAGHAVSLIVTATALDAANRTVYDSNGQRMEVADHRRRYLFRRGPDVGYCQRDDGTWGFIRDGVEDSLVRDDFAACSAALGLAARASASFPAAFTPVKETSELADRRQFPPWAAPGDLSWLGDGGILDNAPFAPVLEEIAQRRGASTHRRVVAYVVPTAMDLTDGLAAPLAKSPHQPPWTSVVSTVGTFPREVDLRDDMEQLAATYSAIGPDVGQVLFDRAFPEEAPGLATQLVAIATAGLDLYRASRAQGALDECRHSLREAEGVLRLDDAAMTGELPDLDGLLWVPREADLLATDPPPEWRWGLATAERAIRLLLRNIAAERGEEARGARERLSVDVDKVVAVRRALLRLLVEDPATTSGTNDVATWVTSLSAAYVELSVPSVLSDLIEDACDAFASVPSRSSDDLPSALQVALAIDVVRFAADSPSSFTRTPAFTFQEMGPGINCRVLDFRCEGDSESASSSTSVVRDPGKKLYGARLGHFGGFLNGDWRLWDYMWGRLDAIAHLGRLMGLAVEDVDALQLEVIRTERASKRGVPLDQIDIDSEVAAVKAELTSVLAMTTQSTLADMRIPQGDDSLAAQVMQRILRFLGNHQGPGLPPPFIQIGGGVAERLLAENDPEHLPVLDELERDVYAHRRRQMWRALRSSSEPPSENPQRRRSWWRRLLPW